MSPARNYICLSMNLIGGNCINSPITDAKSGILFTSSQCCKRLRKNRINNKIRITSQLQEQDMTSYCLQSIDMDPKSSTPWLFGAMLKCFSTMVPYESSSPSISTSRWDCSIFMCCHRVWGLVLGMPEHERVWGMERHIIFIQESCCQWLHPLTRPMDD